LSAVEIGDRILAILRCLKCKGKLQDRLEGLTCAGCGELYPRVNGVVRFVGTENYAGSFGFQWALYKQTQLDSSTSQRSENAFHRRTGFVPEDLAGRLVLDVGCGMGRFAEVATRWGAQVVGIDLSLAVEAAAQNLQGREATIFQSDVFKLPFAEQSFDYIYSIGVLHHTPDCELAFKALPPLLKPGGRMAVWLYSAYNPWYRMSDLYRKFTRRIKPETLHSLCKLAVPLYAVHRGLRKIPWVGRKASGALAWLLPMSFNEDSTWRVLDTFDWYSPWYQSKHTYVEVFRWYEGCGLQDLKVLEEPIAVQGRRPALAASTEHRAAEVEQCAE